MPSTPQDVRESLLVADAEFRRLAEEHRELEAQLEQLRKTPYLSSEDFIREVALKKQKLRLKDRMERIIARRRNEFADR